MEPDDVGKKRSKDYQAGQVEALDAVIEKLRAARAAGPKRLLHGLGHAHTVAVLMRDALVKEEAPVKATAKKGK